MSPEEQKKQGSAVQFRDEAIERQLSRRAIDGKSNGSVAREYLEQYFDLLRVTQVEISKKIPPDQIAFLSEQIPKIGIPEPDDIPNFATELNMLFASSVQPEDKMQIQMRNNLLNQIRHFSPMELSALVDLIRVNVRPFYLEMQKNLSAEDKKRRRR